MSKNEMACWGVIVSLRCSDCPMYPKSPGPRSKRLRVLGTSRPRPFGPWDIRYLGLRAGDLKSLDLRPYNPFPTEEK